MPNKKYIDLCIETFSQGYHGDLTRLKSETGSWYHEACVKHKITLLTQTTGVICVRLLSVFSAFVVLYQL